ncbi:MAG: hypothetical protein QW445_07220, partial [Candidatus Bathyarchaeia archaeon]
ENPLLGGKTGGKTCLREKLWGKKLTVGGKCDAAEVDSLFEPQNGVARANSRVGGAVGAAATSAQSAVRVLPPQTHHSFTVFVQSAVLSTSSWWTGDTF